MTSTRLPGKVLKNVLGKPLLGYQLERVGRCGTIDETVVATTVNATDDKVVEFVEGEGLRTWRGSEADVLSRYAGAEMADADLVVRLTADCPLIDPALVDKVVETLRDSKPSLDFVSNMTPRTLPRVWTLRVYEARH